ncbi:hypothetical protein D4R51_03410 [bacterium]|nr:MAG: hypothetical protein D4R51_03410 [bacterium]
MPYELNLESYQGPLQKLLELIEEKKMEITIVNLAEVTGGFFDYLKKLEASGADHSLLADFLVIASKLLLIKSKVLLPSLPLTEEEELDIRGLEGRLRIYQEFKRAQAHVKNLWSVSPIMFSREYLMTKEAVFYPPKSVTANILAKIVAKVAGELEKFLKPVVAVKNEIIHLKEKIEEILKRLTEAPIGFKKMHLGRTRGELVILFLAILHLIKDQLISADQGEQFDEITIARTKHS